MTVTLLGAAEIRRLAAELDVTPTKKLGQNFVVDANTVRRIVHVAGVQAGERVVEVGPGLGSLTLAILETGASVTAVEIDHRLAQRLPRTAADHGVAPDALTVVDADALRVTELPGDPTVLVANLPYNVSVPVLLHFLETFPELQRGVVMVQAEVGERLAAPPGSKVYGAPSAKAAWYGRWRLAGNVSRQVFWPVPGVDSVLVAFERSERELGSEQERIATFRLVDAAFQQRRKMLRQALAAVLGGKNQNFIERDPTTKQYVLGPQVYAMHHAMVAGIDLKAEARPALIRLSRLFGDTVILSVPAGWESICVDLCFGDYPIRANYLHVGSRRPLGVGAGSLALLMAMSDTEQLAVMPSVRARMIKHYPLYSTDYLDEQLHDARQRGYAMLLEVVIQKMGGLGLAIKGPNGQPIAALSIAALTERIVGREQELAAALKEEVRAIERAWLP